MLVPEPPAIARIDAISPSVYEAALHCLARASWVASGDRSALPSNPLALIGIAVHDVLQRAARSAIPGTTEEKRAADAVKHFDEEMKGLFQHAHPLIQAKFGSHERTPFYNLYRARAARIASQLPGRYSRHAGSAAAQAREPSRLAEATLTSQDQRIRGRPDLIDVQAATVVDYKSASAPDSGQPTASEARQLRLYAYLAMENGIPIGKGVVEHSNRVRAKMPIPRKDAEDEGRRAREALKELNRFSGKSFEEAASASPKACRHCPCIPFCPVFWEASVPSWEEECGTHVEGIIESIEGEALMSLQLQVARGTATRGPAVVSRLSKEWLQVDRASFPEPGQTVRLTDARKTNGATQPTEFRADRATTAVWEV